MIKTLTIRNIALIESVTLQFHHGLHVLSGETGAGKSIIVDAVSLILGGRADRNLIRTGCDKAYVEAAFEPSPDPKLDAFLAQEGIEPDDGILVLSREFSQSGRNTCRINGVMVTLALLKETSSFLLNLHGQSEYQFLADEERQLSYLDLLGNEKLKELKEKVRNDYSQFITSHRYYAKLVKMNDGKENRIGQLSRELEDLRRCAIQPGEEKRISDEAKRLNKSSRIHDHLCRMRRLLGNGEDGRDSLHNLQEAAKGLRDLCAEDQEFGDLAQQCESLYYSLEEIVRTLDQVSMRYDYDEQALENAENRLESVRKLLRKYGPSEEDVLLHQEELEKEFEVLSGLDERLEQARREHKQLLSRYRQSARELTEARKAAASFFEQNMMHELADLGMQHTVIRVSFREDPEKKPLMPTAEGDDRISFLISPNPGEPLKPIAAIASGGELSRLMLALKTVESGRTGTQTMIFDEIDTGISGRIAQAVAEKLFRISRRQQVICISHLPQIAAAGDHQYLVAKSAKDGRTVTAVHEMDGKERVDDIARMISGAQGISENALAYAGQMISGFSEKKEAFSRPAHQQEQSKQSDG